MEARSKTLWFLLVGFMVLVVSCTRSHEAISPSPDEVAAIVNGHVITMREVWAHARAYLPPGGPPADPQQTQDLLRAVADRLCIDWLERNLALERHIDPTEDEVDVAVRTIASTQGLKVEDLVEEAGKLHLDKQSYREWIRDQLRENEILALYFANEPPSSRGKLVDRLAARLHRENSIEILLKPTVSESEVGLPSLGDTVRP